MIQKKTQIILDQLFKNQADMAEKLETAPARISDYLGGKTKSFSAKMIQKLIIDYNIEPEWLFDETDEPIRFRNDKRSAIVEPKYYQAVEKINILQEELIKYQKKDIESLKNSADVPNNA